MQLGVGLSPRFRQGNPKPWYKNAAAYSDLAVVADFNNDRYALPAYGGELVTNGDFSSAATGNPATGWALQQAGSATAAISGGVLSLTGDGTQAGIADQSFTTSPGALYQLTYTVGGAVGVGVSVGISQSNGSLIGVTDNPGAYTRFFTATTATTWMRFFRSGTSTTTLDNVSVREIKLDGSKRSATFDEVFAYTASGTTARTYVASDGTLKSDLAVNARRLTYANGKRQLRLEDARTNLFVWAQDLTNAAWTKTGATISASAVTAPDGSLAQAIVDTAVNTQHALYQGSITATSGSAYTVTRILKAGAVGFAQIAFDGAVFSGSLYANFDLTAGAVGNKSASVTASVKGLGNGWYACSATASATSTSSSGGWFLLAISTDAASFYPAYTGASTAAIYHYASQLEQAAFASDYIPTTSGAVTRAIETARLSPLVEAILQRTAASVVVRAQAVLADGGRILGLVSTSAPSLLQRSNNTTAGMWNGTTQMNVPLGSGTLAGAFGIAANFDATGRSVVGNSGSVNSDANGPGDRTNAFLARDGSATNYGNGYYDALLIAPTRLSNARLQALAVAA